eukprot:TRINITY_DN1860_c0_g1_i1.p1 TRINITY_DN1860_c0_g1~~TRINITY_DN1860_c0_g1_i1.p1  ORF type:complete len:231 (+),score=26.93 TRINITY_DN1860_c0_g1_i1:156-848(+)
MRLSGPISVLSVLFSIFVCVASTTPGSENCSGVIDHAEEYLPPWLLSPHSANTSQPGFSAECCGCFDDIRRTLTDRGCSSNMIASKCRCTGAGCSPDADRKVFTTELARDITMGLVFSCVAGFSVAAGVGGGGIFVPVLIALGGFAARTATALSQCLIFGGSVAGFLLNVQARHPDKKTRRPLIDTSLLLFFSPLQMLGAQIGVFVNQVRASAARLCDGSRPRSRLCGCV